MALEILKFEDLKPDNYYIPKHKKFRLSTGPRKHYDEIIKFFNDNSKEKKEDYEFTTCNLEYAYLYKKPQE